MGLSVVMLVVLSSLGACDGGEPMETETGTETGAETETGACSDELAPTYESFGEAFTLNWCQGCHSAGLGEGERSGAPLGIDFNAHADVLAHLDRVEARAAAQPPTMPPAGGPSDAELELLRQWIACGAP